MDATLPVVDEALENARFPAGFVILGQFIADDITADRSLLARHAVAGELTNSRTPLLDLECVYGDGPVGNPFLYDTEDPDKLLLGADDLPRNHQGTALVGDPRNDVHLLISQLHLAFLRFRFHPRHIAERYGLFTIIVLGESVLAVAVGTADTNWEPSAVLTAAFGFVVAACIWWLYFDHVGSSGIELGPRPAFFWGYGHFAVYAGIAAFGVGTQLAIEATAQAEGALALASAAPAGGYGLGMRLVLAGGVALYLAGIAFVDRVNEGAAGDRAVLVRLATAAFLAVFATIGASLSPPVFAGLIALIMVFLTAFETLHDDRFVRE